MSRNHSEHIKIKDNVHTFYIGFDLDDSGNISQVKSKFYDELFDDITAFAFGTKNVMERIKTPQDISKVQREALRKMYSIPELQEASKYYLESDDVEDKYLKRGEFGELLLYHFLHEYFNADGFPIDYVVTPASVYDGDVDRETKAELALCGIKLISQLRKNMIDYSWFDNYRISRLRKPIETVFSSLERFGIECLRCRNLRALKFRTEAILLTYSLMLESSHNELGLSLKYSLDYA